jgi:tellurite resistance protein TerC
MMWIIFLLGAIALISIDMAIAKGEALTILGSIKKTLLWVSCALIFNLGVFYFQGSEKGLEFLGSYLVEFSLSVDNLFAILLVFQSFHVPEQYQQKVLFWGLLGAFFLRLIFIVTGIALIEHFHFLFYIFGLALIIAAISMLNKKEEYPKDESLLLRTCRKWLPIHENTSTGSFFLIKDGKFFFTSLFLALITIESTDLIFAFDSIPAVFGVTLDPFIAFTSNACAIIGLRSIYFALQGAFHHFKFLHYGICVILIFVGLKMLLSSYIELSIGTSLSVIGLILTISILTSLICKNQSSTL